MTFETLRLMAHDYADRHKEPSPLPALIDTMAYAYQRICHGEDAWTALGDFSNAWYGYARHIRPDLVKDPLSKPTQETEATRRWGAFCAASVEYLCELHHQPCPNWAGTPATFSLLPGGTPCVPTIRRSANICAERHPHPLLAVTSFAVIDSININTKCTNGFRKPSTGA